MRLQSLLWTPLPNDLSEEGELRLSLLLSPLALATRHQREQQ